MVEEQVLLSKYLFDTAIDQFDTDDPFSCGLTVSMLQDSVESLISTIIIELEGYAKPRAGFFDLWDAVESAKKNTNKKTLPHRTSMSALNSARVGFKHHGMLFDASETRKHINMAGLFLAQASREFLNISFEDVSLVDLIHSKEVVELIREAERHFKDEKWFDALVACSKAEGMVMHSLGRILPSIDHGLGSVVKDTRSNDMNRIGHAFSYLSDYLYLQSTLLAISIVGMKVPDYSRFRSLVPSVIVTQGGGGYVNRKGGASEEGAKFCIKYATTFAIKVQNRLGG